ncbi:MAG: hypothetical protein RLZ36_372 [Pseudomonadota bacterium]|jgi:hypothetical protein
MKNLKFIALSAIAIITLTGCAHSGESEMQLKAANDNLRSCIQQNGSKRATAPCAADFYNAILAISTNDYGKPAALNMASSLYAVSLKFDRYQIDVPELKGEIMRIENQFQADLDLARRRTNQENMEAARIRQQAWRDFNEGIKPPAFAPVPCQSGTMRNGRCVDY